MEIKINIYQLATNYTYRIGAISYSHPNPFLLMCSDSQDI